MWPLAPFHFGKLVTVLCLLVHCFAVYNEVYTFGTNTNGELGVGKDWVTATFLQTPNVVAIANVQSHTVFLTRDGHVLIYGRHVSDLFY
jgi:alpha-tubulin suppressor-like RCC1 family protein